MIGVERRDESHASAGPLSPALSPENPRGRGRTATAGRGGSTGGLSAVPLKVEELQLVTFSLIYGRESLHAESLFQLDSLERADAQDL